MIIHNYVASLLKVKQLTCLLKTWLTDLKAVVKDNLNFMYLKCNQKYAYISKIYLFPLIFVVCKLKIWVQINIIKTNKLFSLAFLGAGKCYEKYDHWISISMTKNQWGLYSKFKIKQLNHVNTFSLSLSLMAEVTRKVTRKS